jgi:hypothetical protein
LKGFSLGSRGYSAENGFLSHNKARMVLYIYVLLFYGSNFGITYCVISNFHLVGSFYFLPLTLSEAEEDEKEMNYHRQPRNCGLGGCSEAALVLHTISPTPHSSIIDKDWDNQKASTWE